MKDPQKTHGDKDERKIGFDGRGLYIIIAAGLVLCLFVFRASLIYAQRTEQYTFLAQSLLNILILVAIAIQAWIYYGQWDAMRDSLDAAKASAETFMLGERGDVLLDTIDTTDMIEPMADGRREVILFFKNFGRTRAEDCFFDFILDLELIDEPFEHRPIGPVVLGTGHRQRIGLWFYVTGTDWERISLDDKVRLRFSGTVNFDDIFGKHHTVSCSGTFNRMTGNFTVDSNEAD